MSTNIRPELSLRNKYWIEKHRYYELKHFCLQYPIWKKAYKALCNMSVNPNTLMIFTKSHNVSNPTEKNAISRAFYKDRIEMVENIARKTDEALSDYILSAVTRGVSYDVLNAKEKIPCCRDKYYELYRKFFWLLNKERG